MSYTKLLYKLFDMLRSLTGPAHCDPSELSEDIETDDDNWRDFEDYNYQPQENDEDSEDFELKCLVQVLVDSMEFTADELESAVHSIPTPSGCASDSGTSLREAIEVHMCQYMKVVKNTYLRKWSAMVSYAHDITYDITCDTTCDN